uniref:Putative lucine-rich repeat protein n=1 Tax=Cladonia uncialis subsp. uncialis TaxID=180999 RepID=A0A2K9YE14_CLAUC|nr:putative lucine-rich repeat protein [Cladonia uncialis subsp. uncialis]
MGAVELVYPTTARVPPATVPQYMYYERDMNELSEAIQAQQRAIETRQETDELTESTVETLQNWWQRQMLAQGPWDEINDPDFVRAFKGEPKLLKGAPSLPLSGVNNGQENPDKSFSHPEGGQPDTSYPLGEQFHK